MPATAPPADRRPMTERLRPVRLAEMIGNDAALRGLRTWAEGWTRGGTPARRAAVLSGPPGVGKTTAALAIAAELGWSVVEMNASDARNESAIEQVAGRASLTQTLGDSGVYRGSREGAHALILLDEADCLTGRATESAAHRPAPPSFREYLRTRYGTVEALATAWGLGKAGAPRAFESWESVPASAGRAAWARLAAAQSDIADWRGAAKPRDISDRGGLGAIARLVRETRQPVILTVNDEKPLTRYSPVFRTSVARLRFGPVGDAALRAYLRKTIIRQDLTVATEALDAIVRRSRGDIRAAVNDLDAIAPLPAGVAQSAIFGGRDSIAEIEELAEDVFRHPQVYRNTEIRNRVDATPDDLFPWMEENLPRFAVDAGRRYAAYEVLARAELLLARARRQRVWALWSYASELMTGGVSLAGTQGAEPRASGVFFPSFLSDMGRTRLQRAQRTALAQRTGRRFHVSRRKAIETFLPWMERWLEGAEKSPVHPPTIRRALRALEVTPDDLVVLLGVPPGSPRVAAWTGAGDEIPEDDPAPLPTAEESSGTSRNRQRRLGEF